MHSLVSSLHEQPSPLAPPVASVRYGALDGDLQALIFLSFLGRLGACLAMIGAPLGVLDWGLRHTTLASPLPLPAMHFGECAVFLSALLAALALAFRWHHRSTFGPYEIQFISRGGTDLYPKA
jgi:hypothetical protein